MTDESAIFTELILIITGKPNKREREGGEGKERKIEREGGQRRSIGNFIKKSNITSSVRG